MSNKGRFAYSYSEMYCNDKGFMMTGKSLKFLCAVLNSSLISWVMKRTALTTGMGLAQWKKFAVERIPAPMVNIEEQRPFVIVLERILAERENNPSSATSNLEAEIDRLVYDLYELSAPEVAFLESTKKRPVD